MRNEQIWRNVKRLGKGVAIAGVVIGSLSYGINRFGNYVEHNIKDVGARVQSMPFPDTIMERASGEPWLVDYDGDLETVEQVIYPNMNLVSSRINPPDGMVTIKDYNPGEFRLMTPEEQVEYDGLYRLHRLEDMEVESVK